MNFNLTPSSAQDFEGNIEDKIEFAHKIIDNNESWHKFMNTMKAIIEEAQNCNNPDIVEASEKLSLKIANQA